MSSRRGRKDKEELGPIEEMIDVLKQQGYSKDQIAQILYEAGYPPAEIAQKLGVSLRIFGELASAASEKRQEELATQNIVFPAGKAEGVIANLKAMIKQQVATLADLQNAFFDAGLEVLLLALMKTKEFNQFRQLLESKQLGEALKLAKDTVVKALESYDPEAFQKKIEEYENAIHRLELERDEARLAYTMLVQKIKDFMKAIEPRLSLERMILSYITTSEKIDPEIFEKLLNKWLDLSLGIQPPPEITEVMGR